MAELLAMQRADIACWSGQMSRTTDEQKTGQQKDWWAEMLKSSCCTCPLMSCDAPDSRARTSISICTATHLHSTSYAEATCQDPWRDVHVHYTTHDIVSCSCLAGDRLQLACFVPIFFSLLPQNEGCIPLALLSCIFRATRIKRQALLPYIDYMVHTCAVCLNQRIQCASSSTSSWTIMAQAYCPCMFYCNFDDNKTLLCNLHIESGHMPDRLVVHGPISRSFQAALCWRSSMEGIMQGACTFVRLLREWQ